MNEKQIKEEQELREQTSQFSIIAFALIMLVIASTIFFRYVEGWNLLNSYYFTIVTIATVGYGDLTPTTNLGKMGATIVIIIGIGLFGTFASMLLKRRALKDLRRKIKREDKKNNTN